MAARKDKYYYNIDGNTARKMERAPLYDVPEPRRKSQTSPKRQKQEEGKSFLIFFSIALAFTFFACLAFLSCQAENKTILSEIKSLEKEVERLSTINDSTEYYIYSNYDINNAIDIATSEMGMIQLTKSNIEYYYTPQDEYINQYKEIPY